eukprot:m.296008 g.296008  ORF g.296008 m.296008 type:complete len:304 (+) comp13300_c0_seq1:103-1014(+)
MAASDLPKSVTFSTAGAGGIFGWVCIHPFNTLTVRMSLAQAKPGTKRLGLFPYAVQTVRNEGILTLYRGLGAGIARQIFYATARFGLFEVFRDQLAKYRETDLISRLAAGTSAGACAAFISCPMEVVVVRMANDMSLPPAERRNYTGISNAAVRIAREDGIPAFWRGSIPFVTRAMLVGAFQVASYDQFKVLFRGLGVPKGMPETTCASFSAGLLYSLATMPLETCKNRMAFQKPLADGSLIYRSLPQTMTSVAKSDGILALWRGFFPYYIRCGGHTVAMFIAVEYLRNLYVAAYGTISKPRT